MYFCEAIWAGPGPIPAPAIGAVIAFSGTRSGELRILATTRLATQLAADFLGEELSEITGSQAQSIVHEFANVACGAALNAWMPDGNFTLSVPESLVPANFKEEWPHRFSISRGREELAVEFELIP